MVEEVSSLLPQVWQHPFRVEAERLFETGGVFNNAFATLLICCVWIMVVPGKKARDDAEKAREQKSEKRLKDLDRLIDSGRIIPDRSLWRITSMVLFLPIVAGALSFWVIHESKDKWFVRPLAATPGFVIVAMPDGSAYCHIYSPGGRPKLELNGTQDWYTITPTLTSVPPMLKPPKQAE